MFPARSRSKVWGRDWSPVWYDGSSGLRVEGGRRHSYRLLLLLLRRFSHVQLCVTPQTAAHQAPPVPGILQARTLEWVAISFSNAWKSKVKVKSLSCVWLLVTPWTAAHQAPPSMRFFRQEYWSGVPQKLCTPHPLETLPWLPKPWASYFSFIWKAASSEKYCNSLYLIGWFWGLIKIVPIKLLAERLAQSQLKCISSYYCGQINSVSHVRSLPPYFYRSRL